MATEESGNLFTDLFDEFRELFMHNFCPANFLCPYCILRVIARLYFVLWLVGTVVSQVK